MRRCAKTSARQMIVPALLVCAPLGSLPAQTSGPLSRDKAPQAKTYYGFDLNDYPGDDFIASLHKEFAYAGFWLNMPPGAASSHWTGKRSVLENAGFGFLVLFNGRLDAELRKSADAAVVGKADATAALEAARREGFPAGTIIFLDIEEGGRMLPEQKAYIYAWADGVNAGGFRAGVYCSGIAAVEGHGVTVITANDLRDHAEGRAIVYWVANDGCPPSPGCKLTKDRLAPAESGIGFAEVWQFAQSPERPEMTKRCKATYAKDRNCYVPRQDQAGKVAIDLNTSTEEDPSHGRTPTGR
jgi:Domain of unknown function (DUF1906)